MKKVGKVILIIVIILTILFALGYFGLKKLWKNILTAPMAPEKYIAEVTTGGDVEEKYMAAGSYEIGYFEADYAENADIKKIEIWYPEELEASSEKYPVVLFVNGTGVAASRYKPVFEHLASWGFIAIGNEDPSTREGKKADATLSWLLAANEDETSIFYHRIDTNNIGITGHSQGGVGVFHAINETEHKELYKCAVSLSPTQEDMAEALKMPYDSSKTAIPVMILAGAPNDVISLEGLNDMVKKISAGVVAARRSNTDHGQMLYSGDGYVTAWFMWQLRGDETAAAAFLGENAEILHNANWQDVMINFPNN